MSSALPCSSSVHIMKDAQTADLFDFPTPPVQQPSHARHLTLISGTQKRASKRLSSEDQSLQAHPGSAGANAVANPVAAATKGPGTVESCGLQEEKPVSGQYIANFKRLSKSTTSLPAMLSGYGFEISDDLHLGDYQYYPREREPKTAGEKTTEICLSQQAEPSFPALSEHCPRQLRAAKSHHNLQTPEDCGILSQSMLSMASKVEPLLDVVDLLTPIECGSYEYDACKSQAACAIAVHEHVKSNAPIADKSISTKTAPDLGIDANSSHGRDVKNSKVASQHQGRNAKQLLQVDSSGYLVAEPMELMEPMAASDKSGDLLCNSGSSSSVKTRVSTTPMPRKQMSMAQLEARCRNRNSMLVSGALLPAVSPDVKDEFSEQQRFQHDEADVQLEKRLRRTSRYLYDVPNSGGSIGNGMQGTLSKAFHWPQRIARSTSKRAEKTKSTVIDQYKIYDIYEESIWHSTHTAGAGIEVPEGYGFGLNSSSNGGAVVCSATRKPSAISLGGLRTLRSVASSPGILRLRMSKSQNRSLKSDKRAAGNWNCSDTVYSSEYTGSDSDSSIVLSEAHKQSYPKNTPVRKSSSIHLFVKKASLSLIRRSVSFCKSVSGAAKTSSSTTTISNSAHFKSEGFDGVIDMASQLPAKVAKPKRSYRFATAVRHAGSRLRETLRSADKRQPAESDGQDGDSDVVSAYPTDSMPRCDLDSYLSRSAHNSPSMTTPTNSTTVCDDNGSETDDGSEGSGSVACAKAGKPHHAKYVPPKRPPFLGLHRKSVVGDITSGDANHGKPGSIDSNSSSNLNVNANGNSGYVGVPNGSAFVSASSVPARLRPTQFNSAFTTLPYGAYAQISQLRGQHYPFNGHM